MDFMALFGQRVPGPGLGQFRDNADITGGQAISLLLILTPLCKERMEPLVAALAGIPEVRIGRDIAAHNAQVGQSADVRVG